MELIVLTETAHPFKHHRGGLVADRTVGRIGNGGGGGLNQVNRAFGGGLVKHALDQGFQLGKPYAAGHTLAAGLGVAQAQKIQRQIHRAEPRRVGRHAVPHIAAEVLYDLLRTVRGFDGKSTHTISSVVSGAAGILPAKGGSQHTAPACHSGGYLV